MDIKIKKAKINRNGTVEASYTDAEGNEVVFKGKNKCHNDLRAAFACLIPFFADLTEQKEADRIDWDNPQGENNVDLLRKIDVTGISIGGDDSNRIITLTGRRTLFTSQILNLNSPGVEMDSEIFEWMHIDEFDMAVQAVLFEVGEYLFNRKWEVVQLEMNFDADPDDPFASASPTDSVTPVEEYAESVA